MAMTIPLRYEGMVGDTIIRHHLTRELEVERTYTKETSRGPITQTENQIFPYLEIIYGQAEIMLTTKNASLIKYLTAGDLFSYKDAGHEKLVNAMLGESPIIEKSNVIEAEVIEAEVEVEVELNRESLRKLSMPDLKKTAKANNVKALPSMKKDELISAILGEEVIEEESVEE